MAWQLLPKSVGRFAITSFDANSWRISCNMKSVTLSFPAGHKLASAKLAQIFYDNVDHIGWLRLAKTDDTRLGRKIVFAKGSLRPYIRFSTLPGWNKGGIINPINIESHDEPDGAVLLHLPWYDDKGNIISISAPKVVASSIPPVSKQTKVPLPPPVQIPTVFDHQHKNGVIVPPSTSIPMDVKTIACQIKKEVDVVTRSKEQEKIDEFINNKGAAHCMTMQQMAEYLRSCGRRISIIEPKATTSGFTTFKRSAQPLLRIMYEGSEIDVVDLARVVNTYRKQRHEPPVTLPLS